MYPSSINGSNLFHVPLIILFEKKNYWGMKYKQDLNIAIDQLTPNYNHGRVFEASSLHKSKALPHLMVVNKLHKHFHAHYLYQRNTNKPKTNIHIHMKCFLYLNINNILQYTITQSRGKQ